MSEMSEDRLIMPEAEVVALMRSSKSEQEWDNNCDKVKLVCGGYPAFWFRAIQMSGLMREVVESWNR